MYTLGGRKQYCKPFQGGSSVMVYFCYSSCLNVCVAYIFLFWLAIWPLCGKVTVSLAFC